MHSLRFLPTRHSGRVITWLGLIVAVGFVPPADADESLLPDDAVLRVHVAPFDSLYHSPVITRVWERLQASQSIQDALQTVEARQLQEAIAFIEQQLSRPWPEIYSSLTTGGVELAVTVKGKPRWIVVANAADEQIVDDVVELAVRLAKAERGDIASGEHRGFTGYRLGNASIAAVGSRLLIGSDPELLKATVDRWLDGPPADEASSTTTPFHISARLDLQRFRQLPGVAEGLTIPSDDGGAITILGGWIDLLRRHQSATFDLRLEDDQISTVVRFAGAADASPAEFAGFWADAPGESPAPLLQLPGMISSTSWYRDYGALWSSRQQLVTAEVVAQMETADSEAAAQFETLGSAVSLSEVVQHFGPRFRIVVAPQSLPPYEVVLRNQLPAAALVIELKDEDAFRQIAAPLTRVLHLILSFEQKITSQSLDYAGATLQQLSQPHTPRDVSRRNQLAYNFRPTHTITRGHLIVGSTTEIVQQTIDALDVQDANTTTPDDDRMTSRQFVDMQQLTIALNRLRDAFIRQTVLDRGLDVVAAEQEFDVLLSLLDLLNTATMTGHFSGTDFEHKTTLTLSPQ